MNPFDDTQRIPDDPFDKTQGAPRRPRHSGGATAVADPFDDTQKQSKDESTRQALQRFNAIRGSTAEQEAAMTPVQRAALPRPDPATVAQWRGVEAGAGEGTKALRHAGTESFDPTPPADRYLRAYEKALRDGASPGVIRAIERMKSKAFPATVGDVREQLMLEEYRKRHSTKPQTPQPRGDIEAAGWRVLPDGTLEISPQLLARLNEQASRIDPDLFRPAPAQEHPARPNFMADLPYRAMRGAGNILRGGAQGIESITQAAGKLLGADDENLEDQRTLFRQNLDNAIAPPTTTAGQVTEGLAHGIVSAGPAMAAAAPLALPARAAQAVQAAMAAAGSPAWLASMSAGMTAMGVGAAEFGAAAALPDAIVEEDASLVAHGAAHPFSAAATLAQKIAAGRVEDVTVDEWINAGFLVVGGVLGVLRSRQAQHGEAPGGNRAGPHESPAGNSPTGGFRADQHPDLQQFVANIPIDKLAAFIRRYEGKAAAETDPLRRQIHEGVLNLARQRAVGTSGGSPSPASSVVPGSTEPPVTSATERAPTHPVGRPRTESPALPGPGEAGPTRGSGGQVSRESSAVLERERNARGDGLGDVAELERIIGERVSPALPRINRLAYTDDGRPIATFRSIDDAEAFMANPSLWPYQAQRRFDQGWWDPELLPPLGEGGETVVAFRKVARRGVPQTPVAASAPIEQPLPAISDVGAEAAVPVKPPTTVADPFDDTQRIERSPQALQPSSTWDAQGEPYINIAGRTSLPGGMTDQAVQSPAKEPGHGKEQAAAKDVTQGLSGVPAGTDPFDAPAQSAAAQTQAAKATGQVKPLRFTKADIDKDLAAAMESDISPLQSFEMAIDSASAQYQSMDSGTNPEAVGHTTPVMFAEAWKELTAGQRLTLRKNGVYVNDDLAQSQIEMVGDRAYDAAISYLLNRGDKNLQLSSFARKVMESPGRYDEATRLRAYLRVQWDDMTVEQRRQPQEIVAVSDMPEGTTIRIRGEEFTIVKEGDELILRDGIDLYVEDVKSLPVDKGSMKKPEPSTAMEKTSGPQMGLLGDKTAGGITGSKSGQLFETKPASSKAMEEDAAFREKQTPRDSETGNIFNDDRGAVSVDEIAQSLGRAAFHGVTAPLAVVGRVGKWLTDLWSKPLLRVVEDQGKGAGKLLAQRARQALDHARAIQGELADALRQVQKAAGGASRNSRRAVRELAAIDWSTSTTPGVEYGFTRFQQTVEGARPLPADPVEAAIVQGYRDLVGKTDTMAEQLNIKAFDSQSGTWRPFTKARDGARLLRAPTAEFFDILHGGPGTHAYDALAQVLADANQLPHQVALATLNQLRERSLIKRNAFESIRNLDLFPSHLRIDGRVVPLLYSDPFSAATALVNNSSLRLGFVKAFGGQDMDGTISSGLIEQFAAQGGRRQDAEDLFRSLHAMPIDEAAGRITKPGMIAHEGMRSFRMVLSLYRVALLTRSAIPNLPEPLAKVPAMAGLGRWLRAWGELVRHPQDAAVETARMGARTAAVMNLLVEPGRKREGIARIARELGLRITGSIPVNELNELHSAVAGMIMAADLKAGRSTIFDRVRLELLGFSEAEVGSIMSGSARPELYQAITTRFAEWTQGSTSMASERSRKANSRLWNSLIAFDSYGQMTMDRMGRVNRVLFDALGNARHDPKKAFAAAGVAAGFYLGHAAAGTGAVFILALAVGGTAGLALKWREATHDPDGFALESARYALLSGPADAVWKSATADEGETFEPLERAMLPVSLLNEARQLFAGEGRYRDQEMMERVATFMRSSMPIGKVVATTMVALGISERDQARDAAIAAYWRWRREHTPIARTTLRNQHEEAGRFSIHMRRFHEAAKAGDDPVPHLLEALRIGAAQGRDEKAVAASIRGRRLLPLLEDADQPKLREAIGPEAYRQLQAWDELLSSWADVISPSRQ